MKRYFFILLAALLLIHPVLKAQDLAIGTPAPAFTLKVKNPQGKNLGQKTNRDYLGKWLVLDFWTRTCAACIKAMPKVSVLQNEFGQQASFILVGKNDARYNKGIEGFYKKIAGSEKLQLYTAFDTASFAAYRVRSTPQVVLIDPSGMLYAITSSPELTSEKLHRLLQGEKVSFAQHPDFKGTVKVGIVQTVPSPAPYLGPRTKTQAGEQPGYHSNLSSWTKAQPIKLILDLNKILRQDSLLTTAMSLERLYLLAYLGKADWKLGDSLYLKVAKNIAFPVADSLWDESEPKPLFSYALKPGEKNPSISQWKALLQADLRERFGYQVSLVPKPVTVYRLHVTDSLLAAKLKSKTVQASVKGDATGFAFSGARTADLLARIAYYHPRLLFTDATGLNYPVELSLKANMLDLDSIQLALKGLGLSLSPVTTTIQVLELSRP